MKKVKISFETEDITKEDDSSFYVFKPLETITEQEGYGDVITIDVETNRVYVSDYIDVDDKETRDFIKDNFICYQSLLGFMRRVTQ